MDEITDILIKTRNNLSGRFIDPKNISNSINFAGMHYSRFSFFFVLFLAVLFFSSCNKSGRLRGCVKINGKYGYVDETGSFAIDPQYTNAWSFVRGTAVVKKDKLYGLIDKNGEEIVKPLWDSVIPFSARCFIFGKNGKYGFAEHGTGKELLSPDYEQVYFYTSELCVVQKGLSLGIVNANGELTCPPLLQDLKEMKGSLALVLQQDTSDAEDMLNALLKGDKNSRYGLLNKKGKLVIPTRYDEIFIDENSQWYYPFLQTDSANKHDADDFFHDEKVSPMIGKYGIVDTAGRMIVEPRFDAAPVYGDAMFRITIDGQYGFIDQTGNTIILPQYDYATSFHEGYAVVTKNGKSSIIDKKGATVGIIMSKTKQFFKVSCDRIRFQNTDGRYGYFDLSGRIAIEPSFDVADDFSFNRAIVEKQGNYQLIDKSGKAVNAESWAFIFNLGDGYFQVRKKQGEDRISGIDSLLKRYNGSSSVSGPVGVVDTNGRSILPMAFDEIFHLQPNYFSVEANGLNGCYKKNGEMVYQAKSSSSIYFFKNCAEVREASGCGLIDTSGHYLLPAQYDSIGIVYKGYATVSRQGYYGLIDSLGHIVLTPQFEELQPLVNGIAIFAEKKKYGYVFSNGNKLFSAKFDEASPLIDPDRTVYN